MNNFERQLSNQPLRQPPAEWRDAILFGMAKIVAPAWTWRDWFWPSPAAWGALAAVWVGALVLGGTSQPSSAKSMVKRTPALSLATPLYAFAPHRDLSALLESLN
jgi:hypothetical protein